MLSRRDRCRDKRVEIRKDALTGLARLYRAHVSQRWAPQAVENTDPAKNPKPVPKGAAQKKSLKEKWAFCDQAEDSEEEEAIADVKRRPAQRESEAQSEAATRAALACSASDGTAYGRVEWVPAVLLQSYASAANPVDVKQRVRLLLDEQLFAKDLLPTPRAALFSALARALKCFFSLQGTPFKGETTCVQERDKNAHTPLLSSGGGAGRGAAERGVAVCAGGGGLRGRGRGARRFRAPSNRRERFAFRSQLKNSSTFQVRFARWRVPTSRTGHVASSQNAIDRPKPDARLDQTQTPTEYCKSLGVGLARLLKSAAVHQREAASRRPSRLPFLQSGVL